MSRSARPSAADYWLIAYLGALVILSLRYPGLSRERWVTAIVMVGLAGSFVLARRSARWSWVHDFDPLFVVLVAFMITGPVVSAVNPTRWDAALDAIDHRWFARLSDAWRGALGRPAWLTDIAALAYVSWYAIPIVIAYVLHRRSDRRAFESFVRICVATFIATWIGYGIFPATGPRDLVREGDAFSRALLGLLARVECNHVDAFPSGHTALAIIYATSGARYVPRWRIPLALLAALIIFSTVYLSQHYVIDVVVGAMVALVVLGIDALLRARRVRVKPSAGARPGSRTPGGCDSRAASVRPAA